MKRRAISLLEVILALAILGGSLAVLGEIVRGGARAARSAKMLAYAQLHCENVMAELAAGVRPTTQAPPTALEQGDSEFNWLYSIETQPIDEQGFLAVRVTVTEAKDASQNPVSFSLVRWLVDPQFELEQLQQIEALTEEASATSDSSSSGSSGGSR